MFPSMSSLVFVLESAAYFTSGNADNQYLRVELLASAQLACLLSPAPYVPALHHHFRSFLVAMQTSSWPE